MSEDMKNMTPNSMTNDSKNLECSSKFLYVKKSDVHGIGVFASKNFQVGETVETFPIVPLFFRTHYQGDVRVVDYSVIRSCECEECLRHGNILHLRLGYGGIYNHQDEHNTEILMDYTNLIGTARASRPIQVNDEIFINYGLNYRFPEGKISIRQS